jgi:hypothetical protein
MPLAIVIVLSVAFQSAAAFGGFLVPCSRRFDKSTSNSAANERERQCEQFRPHPHQGRPANTGWSLSSRVYPAPRLRRARWRTCGPDGIVDTGAHAAFPRCPLCTFGLVRLRERWSTRLDRTGRAGILVAIIGTAMFVGTGMITAFVWPVIARHDPGFVAATGPMFADPLTARSIEATYACMAVGYVLLALSFKRARLLSGLDAAALGVGVLMFSVPVEPVGPAPWIVRVAGGVVFGVGLIRTGMALRTTQSSWRE